MFRTSIMFRTGQDQSPKLQDRLWEFAKNECYTDISIVLEDGQKFQAHQNVLAAASPELDREMSTSSDATISFPSKSDAICQLVLEHIYTGRDVVTSKNVFAVNAVAERLMLTNLEYFCAKFLHKHMVGDVPVQDPLLLEVKEDPRLKGLSHRYLRSKLRKHADAQRKLGERLENLRLLGKYTDLQIEVNDETFAVHKNVLAAMSPYFHAMMTVPMSESQLGSIKLSCVTLEAWKLILCWMYKGSQSLFDSMHNMNMLDVLDAAEMMLLYDLKHAISQHLMMDITDDNVISMYTTYFLYEVTSVQEYLLEHFPALSQSPDFLALDADLVLKVLSNPEVKVFNEEFVCDCIFNWLRSNHCAPESKIRSLVSEIRPSDLSKHYLDKSWWMLIKLQPKAQELLVDKLDAERRRRVPSIPEPFVISDGVARPRGLPKPRNEYHPGDLLLLVTVSENSLELYDWSFSERNWRKTTLLTKGKSHSGCTYQAVLNPKDEGVLVLGSHSRCIECLCVYHNFQTGIYIQDACTVLGDCHLHEFGMVTAGKDYYVFQEPEMMVKKLDMSGSFLKRTEVGQLSVRVGVMVATATESAIFVVGNAREGPPGSVIQSFDLQTNQCCFMCLDLTERYRFHHGVVVQNEVWFIGNWGDLVQLTVNNHVVKLQNQKNFIGMRRSGKIQAVVHQNGSIAMIGGFSPFHCSDACDNIRPYGDCVTRNDPDIPVPPFSTHLLGAAVMRLPEDKKGKPTPTTSSARV